MAAGDANEFIDQRVSRLRGRAFTILCLAASLASIVALGVLLAYVAVDAVGWLDLQFLTSATSSFPKDAGFLPAIVGSVFLMVLVAAMTFPVGVGAALYLEEYAPDTRVVRLLQVNIANLAGVPSVVYGLLGLALFVRYLVLPGGSLLVGALTLSLLILPIVVISAQEAIRGVPDSMREASYGMGATRWQTIRNVVLPEALPGIMTGTILALGRAIGETAPLILIGFPTVIYSMPSGLLDQTTAMPMQIFAWAELPQEGFRHGTVPAGVVVLLAVLLAMNSTAIIIRNKYQNRSS